MREDGGPPRYQVTPSIKRLKGESLCGCHPVVLNIWFAESVRPETSPLHLPMTSCNPGKLGGEGSTGPTAGPPYVTARVGEGLPNHEVPAAINPGCVSRVGTFLASLAFRKSRAKQRQLLSTDGALQQGGTDRK
jgi:hypothetical protein